jgi:hypothetical protein
MRVPDLLPVLSSLLENKPCFMIGCVRQNLWRQEQWKDYRGDSLLSVLGLRTPVDTPVGPFDVYMHDRFILQFRGGARKPWLDDDCRTLCALVDRFSSLQPYGVIVLQELDGKLSEYYIDAPSAEDAKFLVDQAIEQWSIEGRIPKNSYRAAVICKRCPAKRRCDAHDLANGQTGDWPKDYRAG